MVLRSSEKEVPARAFVHAISAYFHGESSDGSKRKVSVNVSITVTQIKQKHH
jgi:hypothetical protein